MASFIQKILGSPSNLPGLMAIFSLSFFMGWYYSLFSTMYSGYFTEIGWSSETISLGFSMMSIGGVIAGLTTAWYLAQYSTAMMCSYLSLAIIACVVPIYSFAMTPLILSCLCFFIGVAYTVFFMKAPLIIGSWADDSKKGITLSLYNTTYFVGALLASVLVDFIPLNQRYGFLVAILPVGFMLMISAFTPSLRASYGVITQEKKSSAPIKPPLYASNFRYAPLIVGPILLGIVGWLFLDSYNYLPVWDIMEKNNKSYVSTQQSFFNIGSLFLGLGFGYLLDKFNNTKVILSIIILMILASLGLRITNGDSLFLSALPFLFLGGGGAFFYTALYKRLQDQFNNPQDLSQALGCYNLLTSSASILLPLFYGWWLHAMPTYDFFMTYLIFLFIVGGYFTVVLWRSRTMALNSPR